MRVKLYDVHHEHIKAFFTWEKEFARWLEESADTFFAKGGRAELWNDEEVYCFGPPISSRRELKTEMRDRAA